MPTVPMPLSRGATRGMWRAVWNDDDSLTRSNRTFLGCLARFITHGGRIEWTGVGVLIQQFGAVTGRSYTQRHVLRMLAWAVERGLIRRVRYSAPGRPAVYEAVIPDHPGYAPVKVRRRGVRPRRLLAAWRSERPEAARPQLPADGLQEPAGAPEETRARHRHRLRSPGPTLP